MNHSNKEWIKKGANLDANDTELGLGGFKIFQ
jgi:hypothetical protein